MTNSFQDRSIQENSQSVVIFTLGATAFMVVFLSILSQPFTVQPPMILKFPLQMVGVLLGYALTLNEPGDVSRNAWTFVCFITAFNVIFLLSFLEEHASPWHNLLQAGDANSTSTCP